MIAAFLLGFLGSLHCAGMCGPLVLLTPVAGCSRGAIMASRLFYHTGRIGVYALLGLLFGAIGESIVLAGFQRWLSIAVAAALILGIFASGPLQARVGRIPAFIKGLFGRFLREPGYKSIFALGATNGLLPCGLVYMAATASIARGSALQSMAYMTLFGLGTVPMLFAVSVAGRRFSFAKFPALQKLAPLAAVSIAILLIARADPLGWAQGDSGPARCPACARK